MAGSLTYVAALDWVSLSKASISFSLEVLSRFSKAGVEAFTVAVSQALFKQFRLPADGQRRLREDLAKLKAYSSFGDILWFGVGFRHFIRVMAETEEGSSCIAICACLAVSYEREHCARVLRALCDRSSVPEQFTPALTQWLALVDACAVAAAASLFPILVEGFSRILLGSGTKAMIDMPAVTSADELALALLELAQISNGSMTNITLIGISDCAWLAALAEWLLSLRVEILDSEGTCLYQSQGRGSWDYTEHFQVTIIRMDQGQSHIPAGIVRSRTHVIPPGNLFFTLQDSNSCNWFLRRRSEWSTILSDTFGTTTSELLQPHLLPHFVEVLYSGLNVQGHYPAIYQLNPWEGKAFLENGTLSRLQAFLSFAAIRLPELAPLERYGAGQLLELENIEQKRFRFPYGSTTPDFQKRFGRPLQGRRDKLIYAGYSTALMDKCDCDKCKPEQIPESGANRSASLCLSQVAVSLFAYIWHLAWLDIDDIVRPSSSGLMVLYHNCDGPETIHYTRRQILQSGPGSFLFQLFTGTRVQNLGGRFKSAVSSNGICIYVRSIEDPNMAIKDQLRLRVVPGQIERNGRLYNEVCELGNPWLRPNPLRPLSSEPKDPSLEDNAATAMISGLGVNPLLQIAVEEIVGPEKLMAKVLVRSRANSQIHRDYIYRTVLDSRYITQPQNHCDLSGPASLIYTFTNTFAQSHCHCGHTSGTVNSFWPANNSTQSWSGRCSFAELPWWTYDPGKPAQLRALPQPDEWVLFIYSGNSGVEQSAQVIRGSYPLLYCILSHVATLNCEEINLVQADDCLVCLRPPGQDMPGANLRRLVVRSFMEGDVQQFEALVCSDRTSDASGEAQENDG